MTEDRLHKKIMDRIPEGIGLQGILLSWRKGISEIIQPRRFDEGDLVVREDGRKFGHKRCLAIIY